MLGHMMRRVDSLENTLRVGEIEGRRIKGRQRMRWLDGITDSKEYVCAKSLQSCLTLRTLASQAFLSMGFSRHEYRSGLPFPSLGDLSDPGIEPASLTSPALAGRLFTSNATWFEQTPGVGKGQGKPGVLQYMRSKSPGHG